MKEVLVESTKDIDGDYGTVPGCGAKKCLKKSGAEKLSMYFRFRPEFEIIVVDLDNGHRDYQLKCNMFSIVTNNSVGQGVGSCSTMESKYRYRKGSDVACPSCGVIGAIIKSKDFKTSVPNGWLCYGKKGGCGEKFDLESPEILEQQQGAGKSENTDIADVYNTVLKMAKKRAQVDAILTATGASCLFTQDMEEQQPEVRPAIVPDIQPPKTISHSKLKFIESTLAGANKVVIEGFLKQKNIDPSHLVDATEEAAGEVIAMFNVWATNNPQKKTNKQGDLL